MKLRKKKSAVLLLGIMGFLGQTFLASFCSFWGDAEGMCGFLRNFADKLAVEVLWKVLLTCDVVLLRIYFTPWSQGLIYLSGSTAAPAKAPCECHLLSNRSLKWSQSLHMVLADFKLRI